MQKTVIFNIFKKENNKNIFIKTFYFNINQKIKEIKNIILDEIYDNKFNYLDLENITEKIYKDFGKMFFNKGLLPESNDNFKLSEFTNEDREFSFILIAKNININLNEKKEDKKLIKNLNYKDYKGYKENNKNLLMNDDNFPPLC